MKFINAVRIAVLIIVLILHFIGPSQHAPSDIDLEQQ
jgi:hypothetical protein